MTKFKILVMCPGSFCHDNQITGLDSPERGESRWAQNYALMLAGAGHDVWAASMGIVGPRIDRGVKLISELQVGDFGPYDIYIDSSWWRNKEPKSPAKRYIILKWSLEDYLIEDPLPAEFSIGYPYPCHKHHFDASRNPYKDKTFALPTSFGDECQSPNTNSNRVFLPGKLDLNRPHQKYLPTIIDNISKYPISGVASDEIKNQLDKPGNTFISKLPYSKTMEEMKKCRVNVPILAPAAVIEATFQGLASIFWREGEFFPALGDKLGITIEREDPSEKFTFVFEKLMTNNKHFKEVVQISQNYFSCHKTIEALKYFNLYIESVF